MPTEIIKHTPSKGTELVTVGCKLPHGLHLDILRDDDTAVRVTLNGTNSSRVIGGFGMTDVDKSFFDAWMKANENLTPVKKGLIFAHKTASSAQSEANEKKDLRNGFEGMDPDKPAVGIKPEAFEGFVPPVPA